MPALRNYDLFISHVWRREQNSDYFRLVALLNTAGNFMWRNYSVPEHDPFETKTAATLRSKLDEQIRQASCFLIIAGMYVNYRPWIQEEINIAAHYRKPIIAIEPWGQQRVPFELTQLSRQVVGWNTNSIVDAIRTHSI
jgi:MTH538 TIR-like domain (DUF1863)